MWRVNKEQYKKLVQETAWCGLRVSKDTVYFLDNAGVIRVGTVDKEKICYDEFEYNAIPIKCASGKEIYVKWILMLGSDTRTARSYALAEIKSACERMNVDEFKFKSLAWNKAMSYLEEGLTLAAIIKLVNEYEEKLNDKENNIPHVTGAIKIIECERMYGKKGQPVKLSIKVELNSKYTKNQLNPHIRQLNTEMMHKLMRHWKFKGFEDTMYQYKLTRVYLNKNFEMEYTIELKNEYLIREEKNNGI